MTTQDARYELTKRGPGKFATKIEAWAYGVSLDGCGDTLSLGEGSSYTMERGPFALDIPEPRDGCDLSADDVRYLREHPAGFIIFEDSNGFVDVDFFETKEELDAQWAKCEAHAAEFDGSEDS